MRKSIFLILPFLFMFFVPCITKAQGSAEDVAAHFFDLFQSKGVDDAVDYIYSTNKWLASEKATADNIKMQLKKGIGIIGQYYGYELIEKKSLGESYVMLSYMLRYDRQPIKFSFILYRPDKTWQIQNFRPVERFDEDFDNKPK
jgi:hypothetical protein